MEHIVVSNANDEGPGSLRQAILDAKASGKPSKVTFSIGTGTQKITLQTALPNLTGALSIDGTTQPGYGGTALIQIDFAAGLTIGGGRDVTIQALDLTYTGTPSLGEGVRLNGGTNITIKNCKILNREQGIVARNTTDLRLLDNDLTGSGAGKSKFAMSLAGIQGVAIPGGMEVRGNHFGKGHGGLHLWHGEDLTISDGSVAGSQIVFEKTSGLSELGGQWNILNFREIKNVTIAGLDLSGGGSGVAMMIYESTGVTVQNCKILSRAQAINAFKVADLRILDNDLTGSGAGKNQFAMSLTHIQGDRIPGGLEVRGNHFGKGQGGLRLKGAGDLTISNGSVAGSQIVFEDSSGLAGLGGHWDLLNFSAIKNVTIAGLDLTGEGSGVALRIYTGSNITIQGCKIENRTEGIIASKVTDLRLRDNDLTGSGANENRFAVTLSEIWSDTIPGGLEVRGNTFGKGQGALQLSNARDLTVSDGTIAGSQIIFEETSGLSSLGGQSHLLEFRDMVNLTIANLDLTGSGSGVGLRIYRSTNATVRNCKILNRTQGIIAWKITDLRLQDNDLTGSGVGRDQFAINLANIEADTVPGGLEVRGNTFGKGQGALLLQNTKNITISDGTVANAQIILEDTSGITELDGQWDILDLRNVTNVTIVGLDLSYEGSKATGTALRIERSLNVTIKTVKTTNRQRGILFMNGRDVRVLDCDLTQSGYGRDQFALTLHRITAGTLPGGVEVRGNRFSGGQAVWLQAVEDLMISDGSVAGSNVALKGLTGLTAPIGVWGAWDIGNISHEKVTKLELSFAGEDAPQVGLRLTGHNAAMVLARLISGIEVP